MIEEIVEMMENSPDPGETEEEEEDDIAVSSSKSSPSLLEEIRMLSQASNNNCSYEGARSNLWLINMWKLLKLFMNLQMKLDVRMKVWTLKQALL